MFGLGWQELAIILGIALVIFGPKKLPELGKSLGEAISGFRQSTDMAKSAAKKEIKDIEKTIVESSSSDEKTTD